MSFRRECVYVSMGEIMLNPLLGKHVLSFFPPAALTAHPMPCSSQNCGTLGSACLETHLHS